MRRGWLGLCFWLLMELPAWAAPDTTMSVTPVATSGTTITASDENGRNNTISTAYNAHSHTDISQTANTLNVGDGLAGTKQVCFNAADTIDACLRWDDANNLLLFDQVSPGTYNTLLTTSGTSAIATNSLMVSVGGGVLGSAGIVIGSTVPATFGDFSSRVYNTSAEAITSGTATILTYDTERFDTDTIHSTSSNTGRLTATTAGKYAITGHIEWAAPASIATKDGQRLVEILLNGATVIASENCGYTGEDPLRAQPCGISTYYNLVATDYVELRVTQRVNTTLNVNASTNYSPEFEMVKVP